MATSNQLKRRGLLFVLSSPSGAGKTTIARMLLDQDSGISLAMQAKAMAAAGEGETLKVQNVQSKKVLQAVVTGPGQAVVGPAADQLKAARSTRYAFR